MAGLIFQRLGHFLPAAFGGIGAAGMEAAAADLLGDAGEGAGNGPDLEFIRVHIGDRCDQAVGIGVQRIFEDLDRKSVV